MKERKEILLTKSQLNIKKEKMNIIRIQIAVQQIRTKFKKYNYEHYHQVADQQKQKISQVTINKKTFFSKEQK